MPKVETKLYRKPEEAKKAIDDLKAKGFKPEEIGAITSEHRKNYLGDSINPTVVVDSVVAMGAAAAISKAGANLVKALTELWGIPEETATYYQRGVALGGILVSVHVEDAKAAQARQILRAAAGPVAKKMPLAQISPGFLKASRMTATNPIDAPMSGDFRRY
jgi:hypothetical protein